MDTSGQLALNLLKSVHDDPPAMTTQIRLAVEVALSVCEEQRLYPGPGPWLRENEEIRLPKETKPIGDPGAAPCAQARAHEYDEMAKHEVMAELLEPMLKKTNAEGMKVDSAGHPLSFVYPTPSSGDAPEGARRVLYRQTKSGLFQLTQRRKLIWETHIVRRVMNMDFGEAYRPDKHMLAELEEPEDRD